MNEKQKPSQPAFDVNKIQHNIEKEIRTPLPNHAGIRPTDFAPPAVRNGSMTMEDLRRAGKLAADAMAKQYLSAAEAILQTGREYAAAQNKLAVTLIEEARILEEEGKAIMKEYERVADEYRNRATQISADLELATGKSDKAISLCHEMLKVLSATESLK